LICWFTALLWGLNSVRQGNSLVDVEIVLNNNENSPIFLFLLKNLRGVRVRMLIFLILIVILLFLSNDME